MACHIANPGIGPGFGAWHLMVSEPKLHDLKICGILFEILVILKFEIKKEEN